MKFQKGSEWRKWDLHIHTPNTKLNDNFRIKDQTDIWKQYCDLLEGSDVDVFGITDYFSCDNYFTFITKFIEYHPNSKKKFFPNIELRLEVSVNKKAEEINLHILFDNDVSKDKINEFLQKLDSNITRSGAKISCLNLQPDDISSAGVDYKVIQQKLKEVFGTDKKYLILAASNNAGLRPDTDSPRKLNITDEIDKICDCFFGGQQNVKYFLDVKRYESQEDAEAKPVVTCCDAHSFDELKNWLGKRFVNDKGIIEKDITWIKTDPTFEGLKQIIYEPELRVRIQETNPVFDKEKLVIDYFKIMDSNGFIISDEKISFNRDLVCIIGGRGSGKSAILESIAYCFNAHIQNDKPLSFIFYYCQKGANPNFALQYLDLDNKPIDLFEISLMQNNETPCSYPFLYLSQNQIENFASDRQFLHGLAFETVIKNSSFTDELTKIQSTINIILQQIEIINHKLLALRELVAKADQKSLENETLKLKGELKLLESESTRAILNKLNKAQEKRSTINQAKDVRDEILGQLNDVKESVNVKLLDLYSSLDILHITHDSLELNFVKFEEHLDEILSKLKYENHEEEYQQILSEVKDILKDKLDVSVEHIEALRNKISLNESAIKSLQKDKDHFSNVIKIRHQKLVQLNSFFNDYERAYKKAIEEFSKMNQDILGTLELETELDFNTDNLCEYLLDKCIDKRKIKTKDKIITYMGLLPKLSFRQYIDWIDVFLDETFDIDNYDAFYPSLKNDIENKIVLNIPRLLTKINYKLGSITKNIDQLSLGQKGTIILKLFLSIGNNCPIVIDQPEDHLDNSFIYDDLVQTFRNAKKKRQIIVVTHNANLVVNGDADQVIVAEYDNEKINHAISGSIENPIIKEKVTIILEGGLEAFRKREKKYQYDSAER